MRGKRLLSSLVVIGLVVGLSGCTVKISSFNPNSHFAYPNANVKPLGQVSAETSRTRIFIAKMVDQEMMDEVITKALKSKGGDLLINFKLTTEVTQIPIPFIPIFITTLKIDGTAASQEVGRQQVR